MPSNLLAVDTAFPTFTPEQSSDEKLDVVTNYLYMLLEQLRYTLANLGVGNFNDAELSELGLTITKPIYVDLENVAGSLLNLSITADNLSTRLENAEGDISSIDQYAKSITMTVENGDTSSSIKLMAGSTEIASQIIQMNGLVTFRGLENGTTVINGGCIQTGTIDAEYLNLTGAITFDDLSQAMQTDLSGIESTANDAYELAEANKPPEYIKGSYIDSAEIRSPTIKANNFSVLPLDGGEDGGSFNLYGLYNGDQYHFLEINYHRGTGPEINFSSPASAHAYWDFPITTFYGNLDFSSAAVSGLPETTAVFA